MPRNPQPIRVLTWRTHVSPVQIIEKSEFFCWTDEVQKAFENLKALNSKPPVLASLKPGETFILYVSATTQVISSTLVVELEEPGHVYEVQRPVYYTSKVLFGYKTHYN
jgi:hypothetical protein